jgi:hypothetical protein
MDPFDDRDLSRLLREWKAPDAPPTLRQGLRRGAPLGPPDGPSSPWWRWLFAGTIRVPVPVAMGVALLLVVWAYTRLPAPTPFAEPEPTVSLADFEPVRQLEPRVVGEFK